MCRPDSCQHFPDHLFLVLAQRSHACCLMAIFPATLLTSLVNVLSKSKGQVRAGHSQGDSELWLFPSNKDPLLGLPLNLQLPGARQSPEQPPPQVPRALNPVLKSSLYPCVWRPSKLPFRVQEQGIRVPCAERQYSPSSPCAGESMAGSYPGTGTSY